MLSSLLENLAALHLNLKWTKSPHHIIVIIANLLFFFLKTISLDSALPSARSKFFKYPVRLRARLSNTSHVKAPYWGFEKTEMRIFFYFFFFSPGVARLVLLLRSVSRGARETVQPPPLRSARQPPLPTVQTPPAASSAKHRRLSARQVCFCFVFVFNLAAQRGFVVHKDRLPAPSCRGFHPCGSGRPAESLIGASNVSEDDKLKCTFL